MIKRGGIIIFALAAGLLYLFPLLWMALASLLPDEEVLQPLRALQQMIAAPLSFENYSDVFARVRFFTILGNTLLFTGVIVVVGLLINSAAGYALARLTFPGKPVLLLLLVMLIIIPYEALVIPLFLMIGGKAQMVNSLPGLFLPYLVKAFNVFFMRQHFLSLPLALEEAARMEGASWYTIFWRIGMPLAKPALITLAILDFSTHWSEYLWPLVITNDPAYETMQTGLGHFYTSPPIQWGDIMAYSVLATLPLLLIFTFFQRHIVLNLATTGFKEG